MGNEPGVVLVTGADRGLGLAMTAGLLARGWRVFAGQFMPEWPELGQLAGRFAAQLDVLPLNVASTSSVQSAAQRVKEAAGRVDMLINNAGVITPQNDPISTAQNYDEFHRVFDVNSLGPLRVVEAFLPLLEASTIRRMCFVSSEAGSIGRSHRNSWFAYCMSKSALNMGISILFNDLHPRGFTFRVYHPGWVRSYMSGKKNLEATLEPEEAAVPALNYFLSGLSGEPQAAPDENRVVMRDYEGQEWPW